MFFRAAVPALFVAGLAATITWRTPSTAASDLAQSSQSLCGLLAGLAIAVITYYASTVDAVADRVIDRGIKDKRLLPQGVAALRKKFDRATDHLADNLIALLVSVALLLVAAYTLAASNPEPSDWQLNLCNFLTIFSSITILAATTDSAITMVFLRKIDDESKRGAASTPSNQ